jgi:putative copper export protein
MSGRTMAFLMTALVFGVLVFGLWYQNQHPRRIVGEGQVRVSAKTAGAATMTLKTRDIEINGARFSEVEMPNGTWLGCEGDCAKAAREAGEDFWKKLERERH